MGSGHCGHDRMVVGFSNYLCNQCLSLLKLWVQIPSWQGVLDTTLCYNFCQWLATDRWFSPGAAVSSTNKTDHHDIAEILLKVALNTINLTWTYFRQWTQMKSVKFQSNWPHTMFFMIIDEMCWMSLIFYLLFLGTYGLPRSWYFPLQTSYWCGTNVCKGQEVEETNQCKGQF